MTEAQAIEFEDQVRREEQAKEVVDTVSRFVNSMSRESATFVRLMGSEHRTLQQSFTRLCLEWLKHCASEDYRFDLRNEDSHEVAKKMLSALDGEDYIRYI